MAADLEANEKPVVFVVGHEPAFPQPDDESGRERHMNDSLNNHAANRDRFWQCLKDFDVTAYICGHTHNYSAAVIDGMWQIDAGHARGTADAGARSTFLGIAVYETADSVLHVYRLNGSSGEYERTASFHLN